MTLNTLDLLIIGVIALSGVLSLFRGFASEALSLLTWTIALWLPFSYTEKFSAFLPDTVQSDSARWFISAAVLFFSALIICSTIGFMIRKLLVATNLGFMDRFLGVGLGAVRGFLIVALIALLATANPAIPKERWWNESKLMPLVLNVSKLIHSQLPANIAGWFNFNKS
ncbi:hypothetical protein AB833_06915 [Chromatiales bacterium (ex Bugula neritina AB1)]|nr:hypothetical protein AB833_06915 [Chromatiales bacterium (ex Bugula neritina AB1)]